MSDNTIHVRGRVYDREQVETIGRFVEVMAKLLIANGDSVDRNRQRLALAMNRLADAASAQYPRLKLAVPNTRGALESFGNGARHEFVEVVQEVFNVSADDPRTTVAHMIGQMDRAAQHLQARGHG